MTDREKIVEIMAESSLELSTGNSSRRDFARTALKALEKAGYRIVPKETNTSGGGDE